MKTKAGKKAMIEASFLFNLCDFIEKIRKAMQENILAITIQLNKLLDLSMPTIL